MVALMSVFAAVQVCNHPLLCYPSDYTGGDAGIIRQCGKMYLLDRILVKMFHSGHRVLLFSTMTKLLDLLEDYLRWRHADAAGTKMKYARIDGGTSLEDREKAIQEFNKPDSGKQLPGWYASQLYCCV